jgi:hypothetical protein
MKKKRLIYINPLFPESINPLFAFETIYPSRLSGRKRCKKVFPEGIAFGYFG